jgi:hypothetical protein
MALARAGNQPQAIEEKDASRLVLSLSKQAKALSNVKDMLPVLSLSKDEAGTREGQGTGGDRAL